MVLKVIDNDNVKILIEQKDLENTIVNIEALDVEDEASMLFIAGLLEYVYKKTGVNFLDSKVVINVVSGIEGAFYIIVTRLLRSSKQTVRIDESVKADEDMYLFEFDYPETIYDIYDVINTIKDLKCSKSKLYKYKSKYYLALFFPPKTISDKKFDLLIKEIDVYSKKCKWSILNESFLEEWGEVIAIDPLYRIKK